MSTGKATRAELEELHGLLVRTLREVFKTSKKQPVDILQVTRKTLRDNGVVGTVDEALVKQLQELYQGYSKALASALQRPSVSAGVLAEARHWLEYHGFSPDVPTAQVAAAAKKLGNAGMDLPFVLTKQ